MTMGTELSEGVSMVTCLSLAISYPSIAAAPHMFINGYKNLLAIVLQTHYSFPLANKYLLHERINKLNMISELPDDILLHVLSFLTLKEAGKTSVLSKRWRHIWAYIPNLNFDFRVVLDEFVQITKLNDTGKSLHKARQEQGPKYINWVDQVVSSHKASTIDEFRVRFEISLFRNSTEIVDNWFRFAMEKRVKKLEVDMSHSVFPTEYYDKRPTFPSLSLCNSLTFLELGCVNIQGEILESFLCNCRALEHLSVKYSKSLVHLKVSGPSLNLKHLIIYKCYEIEHLEIYAPNLESVCYSGPKINVQFKSAPKLAQVTFGSSYAGDLMNICSDLSNCLSQITELTLDSDNALECPNLSLEESVIFTKLEKLDVMVFLRTEDDLYCFIPLIKACPLLKHFKLRRRPYNLYDYMYYPKREQREWETTRLYNLKIVEIVGFVGHALDLEYKYDIVGYLGHAVDIELAAYLDKSAVSLDKIIADTRDPCPGRFEYKWRRKEARKWAEELRAKLKPSTELEII